MVWYDAQQVQPHSDGDVLLVTQDRIYYIGYYLKGEGWFIYPVSSSPIDVPVICWGNLPSFPLSFLH